MAASLGYKPSWPRSLKRISIAKYSINFVELLNVHNSDGSSNATQSNVKTCIKISLHLARRIAKGLLDLTYL